MDLAGDARRVAHRLRERGEHPLLLLPCGPLEWRCTELDRTRLPALGRTRQAREELALHRGHDALRRGAAHDRHVLLEDRERLLADLFVRKKPAQGAPVCPRLALQVRFGQHLEAPRLCPDATVARAAPVVRAAEDWQAKIAATAGGRALVVDFTAPWCKPCQKIYPFFKRLAATFDEAATFVKVDVDDLEDVAEAAKVTMMPTFQVYRDGALAGALSGANENNLRHFVETHCLGAKKEN